MRVQLVFGKKYRDLIGETLSREIEQTFRSEDRFNSLQPVGGRRRERHVSDTDEAEGNSEYEYARGQYEAALS